MPRENASRSRLKVKIGISLDRDLYEWLASRTGSGREFASISHAVERSVALYQARQRPLRDLEDGFSDVEA